MHGGTLQTLLLSFTLSILISTQIGQQPIHIAVQYNHENVVQMLVDEFNVKLDSTNDVIIKHYNLLL